MGLSQQQHDHQPRFTVSLTILPSLEADICAKSFSVFHIFLFSVLDCQLVSHQTLHFPSSSFFIAFTRTGHFINEYWVGQLQIFMNLKLVLETLSFEVLVHQLHIHSAKFLLLPHPKVISVDYDLVTVEATDLHSCKSQEMKVETLIYCFIFIF